MQESERNRMNNTFPHSIDSGSWPYGHCQGIAVDPEKRLIYFSFTTALIKMDFTGRVLGTVTGLLGHLGCIAFCKADGRIYGSLEYKNDVIGQGILNHANSAAQLPNAFYIAIFDGNRIVRPDMDACSDHVMTTVYLKEVLDDYSAEIEHEGRRLLHRYGCSGIDGITFGRTPGTLEDRDSLFVAYGVYGDVTRTDNDHQVILRYDTTDWKRYERPLRQDAMHTNGPLTPEDKLFVFTGNTCYGVQNLEYDALTGNFLMAVYRGQKEAYPNYDLFVIDGRRAPEDHRLTLLDNGTNEKTPGWRFAYGATGLCALGDGQFYISQDGKDGDQFFTHVVLYRWDGQTPFVPVP